jgi:hypothetical protein
VFSLHPLLHKPYLENVLKEMLERNFPLAMAYIILDREAGYAINEGQV